MTPLSLHGKVVRTYRPPNMTRLGSPRGTARLALLLMVAITGTVVSCTGGGDGATSADPSPEEIERARAILEAANLDDEASIDGVSGVRFTEAGVRAAADAIGSGATGGQLWAATWVYASSGTDPAVLQPLLTNEDPSIRLMASGALVSLGDLAGFDVLVNLIEVGDRVEASHPPISVQEFAVFTLERYTGVTFGSLGEASAEELGAAWSGWLEQNHASLRFDDTTVTWVVG